jgi:hypothetical protein
LRPDFFLNQRLALLPITCCLALLSPGCSDAPEDQFILGPIDAGPFTPPPVYSASYQDAGAEAAPGCEDPPPARPSPGGVALSIITPCAKPLEIDAATASLGVPLAVSADRLLLPSGKLAALHAPDLVRCPTSGTLQAPFGEGVGAVRGASIDVLTWLAGSAASGAYDTQGKPVAICAGAAALQVVADQAAPTRAYAIDGGGSLRVLTLAGGAKGTECAATTVALGDGKGQAVALAASTEPGRLWASTLQSDGCSSHVQIARYLVPSGALDEGFAPLDATALGVCSVDALVDLGGRVAVADATCGRVLVIDTSGAAPAVAQRADIPGGYLPRAVASGSSKADRLLVLAAASAGKQSGARLFTVPLLGPSTSKTQPGAPQGD